MPINAVQDVCSPRHRHLYRLLLSRHDIHQAIEACKLAIHRVDPLDDLHYRAVLTEIVTCYARAFAEAKPLGRLPDSWSRYENGRYQWLHDQLIALRNKTLAYTQLPMDPFLLFVAGKQLYELDLLSFDVTVPVERATLDRRHIPDVQAMCNNFSSRLHKAILDERDRLFRGRPAPLSVGAS